MSAEDRFFAIGVRRHDELLTTLTDLEQVGRDDPGAQYPAEAIALQASIWRYLRAYGRRDEHGQVDTTVTQPIKPWRPSPAQLAAHAAGLPIPPDEEDSAVDGEFDREIPERVIGGDRADVVASADPAALIAGAGLDLENDGSVAGGASECGGQVLAGEHAPTVEGTGRER